MSERSDLIETTAKNKRQYNGSDASTADVNQLTRGFAEETKFRTNDDIQLKTNKDLTGVISESKNVDNLVYPDRITPAKVQDKVISADVGFLKRNAVNAVMTSRGKGDSGDGEDESGAKGPTADYVPSVANNNNQAKNPGGERTGFVSSYLPTSSYSKPESRNASNNGRLGGAQNAPTRPSPVGFLARQQARVEQPVPSEKP